MKLLEVFRYELEYQLQKPSTWAYAVLLFGFALGNAIALLLTDHPLADTLARAGHDFVVANFSIGSMVNAVTRIYEEGAEVVARRSGATLTAA